MIIFDEATSVLDNDTQRRVIDHLNTVGTTRIVAAQRLSMIRDAHRIYVIESGQLVQCGKYEELSAQSGPFRQLTMRARQ